MCKNGHLLTKPLKWCIACGTYKINFRAKTPQKPKLSKTAQMLGTKNNLFVLQ